MSGPVWDSVWLRLLAVILLVGANAFFVAAEFALVASRRTRIDAMVRRGDSKARVVKHALQSLDRYISGTQLGITLASLGLGWIGEPALAGPIEGVFRWLPPAAAPIATHGLAATLAFALITFLHIVLGELAPKALALLRPEQTSRWVARPLIVFTIATNPFIWLLNGTANAILRLFGARAQTEWERVHSPEEIMMLVEQTRKTGRIAAQGARMIEGVFEFSEKNAREVMTPRTAMVAFPVTLSLEAVADRVAHAGRSRYPVYRETLDDIVGTVHAKDILAALRANDSRGLEAILRPALFVPGTREVEDVLADMKRQKTHIAIVLDDRILLVDLKDWHGRITSDGAQCSQNDRVVGTSPVKKILDNARILAGELRQYIRRKRPPSLSADAIPLVEGCVVLRTNQPIPLQHSLARQVGAVDRAFSVERVIRLADVGQSHMPAMCLHFGDVTRTDVRRFRHWNEFVHAFLSQSTVAQVPYIRPRTPVAAKPARRRRRQARRS